VAFVRHDQVEGVDGDVQLARVLVDVLITQPEDGLPAEDVDGHPLDGGDVHEGLAGFRVSQVTLRKQLGVELLLFPEILPLELRAIDFVDLIELLPGLRVKRGEGTDSLGGESATIHEEQDALRDAGLHQAVDLVTRQNVFPVPVAAATSRFRLRSAIAFSTAALAAFW